MTQISKALHQAVSRELTRNKELRSQLQMEPLNPSVIRGAIDKHQSTQHGLTALVEHASRENAKLQARVDAGDRGPDQYGRVHGQELYRKPFPTAEARQALEDTVRVAPHQSMVPPEEQFDDPRKAKRRNPPRTHEEAMEQLAEAGLLAPEGSQVINDTE